MTAATVTTALLGMRNTFSTGFEFNHTTFQHDNNSPYSGTSTVDPFNFDPGSFINTAGTYPKYRSGRTSTRCSPRTGWKSRRAGR